MARKEEFYFTSSCGTTKIHAVRYIPEGNITAILQITHGMVEYIERYEDFALFMASKGFLVTGHDHLGHGKSINSKEEWGYFAKEDGNKAAQHCRNTAHQIADIRLTAEKPECHRQNQANQSALHPKQSGPENRCDGKRQLQQQILTGLFTVTAVQEQ